MIAMNLSGNAKLRGTNTSDNQGPEMSGQRVWFVSEVFYPEMEGAGYYITEVARAVARRVSTFAICTPPTYSRIGSSAPRHETFGGVRIIRCFAMGWNRHRMIGRMVNATTFCISVFLHLLFRLKRGDVVLCACYPPPVAFFTTIAAKIRGSRHLLYVMDIHPDMAVAVGIFKKTSLVVRVADLVNGWIYRSSAKVIVIGRDMRTYVETTFRVPVERIDSIPLFVDSDHIRPMARSENELLSKYDLVDKFVVGIGGNIGAPHDAKMLLEAAQQTGDLSELRFLAIGSGKRFDWLRKEIRKEGLTNFVFVDRLPRSETCMIANACDIAIGALYIPGMFGLACPSRIGSLLAAGKSLVAIIDSDTELAAIIDEYQVGWRIDPRDTAGFLKAIREAYMMRYDKEKVDAMSKRARGLAVNQLGREVVLDRYVASILGDEVAAASLEHNKTEANITEHVV